jgi:hypothetical protein
MNPRRQGDLGEYSAIEWLGSRGYPVWFPVGHAPDCDLVTEIDGRLLKVQVKTSTLLVKRRFQVALRTSGGNRSWSEVVKRFCPERCDWLFVLVADGRRWFIPATDFAGASSILLGGPKYAAYEVEPGRPLSPAIAA